MKVLSHLKNAIRYEWFDVLFDRFYSVEHCGDLPLNDLHQDFARRITFGWGFSFCLGINTILWIFVVFRLFGDLTAIILAAAMLLLSLLGGAAIGAIYLWIALIKIQKKEQERLEAERRERVGEKHENG